MDESNVQISSLKEQLTDAQQQLTEAEAASTSLQHTEADVKQQLQELQVCLFSIKMRDAKSIHHVHITEIASSFARQHLVPPLSSSNLQGLMCNKQGYSRNKASCFS